MRVAVFSLHLYLVLTISVFLPAKPGGPVQSSGNHGHYDRRFMSGNRSIIRIDLRRMLIFCGFIAFGTVLYRMVGPTFQGVINECGAYSSSWECMAAYLNVLAFILITSGILGLTYGVWNSDIGGHVQLARLGPMTSGGVAMESYRAATEQYKLDYQTLFLWRGLSVFRNTRSKNLAVDNGADSDSDESLLSNFLRATWAASVMGMTFILYDFAGATIHTHYGAVINTSRIV